MFKIALSLLCFFSWALVLTAQTQSLNAAWEFQLSEAAMPADLPTEGWHTLNLPHTWNAVDAHDDVRGYTLGTGWYKKTLFIPKTKNNQVFIKFEGANQHTILYVNGQKAGEHQGGYTAFVIDITHFIELDTQNELFVWVSNEGNRYIPPLSGDFTFYGGIYRDLWLIRKGETHFDLLDGSTKGVYLSTDVSETKAALNVKAKIKEKGLNEDKILSCTVYDRAMQQVAQLNLPIFVPEDALEVALSMELEAPNLWSPDDPYLYTVDLKLTDEKTGELEDHYVDRIGFRWFEMADNGAFKLNGEVLKLVGTNRHQDFPKLGNALPDEIHHEDMELLKQMGGNFTRVSHYPQDPAILEACDELGILVWEEAPIVNSIVTEEAFTQNALGAVREMVRQHYNHTSVIVWGYFNEIMLGLKRGLNMNKNLTRPEYLNAVRELAMKLDSTCKAEDPKRFTTIANHARYELYEEAKLNDVADILGWNIYYGWYGTDFSNVGKYLDRYYQDYPDKGIILSEYGAGADPRIHADEPQRFDFSEEWQMQLHANYLPQVLERPYVMGAAAWNFADFGSEGRKDAVPRINSKGILTVDRKPKDAYLYYQAALSQAPICKIGASNWRNRTGIASTDVLQERVYIFSNQEEVELVLNGRSLGNFKIENYHLQVEIPFKAGENELVAKAGTIKDRALFNIKILPEQLTKAAANEIDLCINLGTHIDFYDPIRRQYWLPEQAYQKGGMGYVGGAIMKSGGWRVGTGNEIVGSDLEPVYQTHRDTIEAFRADLPNGWYEVTLHFAEIYSAKAREKLIYNLGADETDAKLDIDRAFEYTINGSVPTLISDMKDFGAIPIKTRILVEHGKGLDIRFNPLNGSAFLCGLEIRGL